MGHGAKPAAVVEEPAVVAEEPVAEPDAMAQVTADATGLLRARHRISAFRPDDFKVGSQKELIETQIASANRLGFLVRC